MDASKPGFLTRLLESLARFIYRRSIWVIAAGLLLVLFSAFLAFTKLGFKTSGSDLISSDDEVHKRLIDYMAEFRNEEDFVILVESPDPALNREVIKALADRIKQEALLVPAGANNLLYKIDDSSMAQRGLLYLPQQELVSIRDRLKESQRLAGDHGETASSITLARTLETISDSLRPQGNHEAAGDEAAIRDQLKFLQSLLRSIEGALENPQGAVPSPDLLFGQATALAEQSTYFEFDHGKALLLLLTPAGEKVGFTPFTKQIALLRSIVEEMRDRYPTVKFGLTGEPVLTDDEQNTYQRDTMIGLAFTLLVVFLIFAWAYRGIMRPILKIGVLLAAVVCALGFAAISVGHLNMLSVAFIVMILGLGDDFAIYVITRYEEERRKGLHPEEALVQSLTQAGHSVVMASLTIAISFSTMVFTGFEGLAEMGIIAAGGILICAVLCLTLLPALLLQQKAERGGEQVVIRHVITPMLLSAERKMLARAPWVVGATLLFTAIAFFSVFRIGAIPRAIADWRAGTPWGSAFAPVMNIAFQYDLLDLHNASQESVQTVRRLSDFQSIYFSAVVTDSLEDTRRLEKELAAQASVGSVVSILGASDRPTSTLPDAQEEKLPIARETVQLASSWNATASADVDVTAVEDALQDVAAGFRRMGRLVQAMGESDTAKEMLAISDEAARLEEKTAALSPEEAAKRLGIWQQGFGEMLNEAFARLATMKTDRVVELADLPESLRTRYIGKTGKFLLEVYPAQDLRDKDALEKFCAEVLAVAPQATGTPIELNIFVDLLKFSYLKAALYALTFVILLIIFYFRSWLATLLCLFPLFAGIVLMLGVMRWFGFAFNPANIITLPLIIGIGVDNGILILQRFRHEPDIELFSKNTGRAILMSNLSTMAGFLGLSFAQHQGIASLGMIMCIGIGMTMLVSLTALPAMIHLLKLRKISF